MKIIGVSYYNTDWLSDVLVCTGIDENARYGQAIIDHFNALPGGTYSFKLVPDDYVLHENTYFS